jgi:hypothetical protein
VQLKQRIHYVLSAPLTKNQPLPPHSEQTASDVDEPPEDHTIFL